MSNTTLTKERVGRQITSSIAMTVILVTFSMLFASLLLGFTVFRLTSDVWPPMGFERVDLFLPTISTIVIAISSFTFWKYEKLFLVENAEKKLWLSFTMVLGFSFMVAQAMLWSDLHSKGIYVQDGIFPSIIFSFTWTHAAHVVVAWFLLFYLVPTLKEGVSVEKLENRVFNIGKFWHFLGVVWLIMYITIFLF
ncbi:heme-copper oxidase subunit III [Halobacteriovorax sp.]|uniref:cytochrome c oxidase subunit 3 n=1 Tax=Halobacteriovorax sp. TaxID=2020862 RepID=UPI00356A64BF